MYHINIAILKDIFYMKQYMIYIYFDLFYPDVGKY